MPRYNTSDRPNARERRAMIHADRWVVALRVVVGAWFVKAVWAKLTASRSLET